MHRDIERVKSLGRELIDSHQIISFDIYDTLIVRDCKSPEDVFTLVEKEYEKLYQKNIVFKDLRKKAERTASKEITAPTIQQIYEYINLEDKEELQRLELSIENNIIYKKYIGQYLYQYALRQGKVIVAVSDMYYDSNVITQILENLDYHISKIYISCECHVVKCDGKLFELVLNELGADRRDVVHFGDNLLADILGASIAGVDSMHIPSQTTPPYFASRGEIFYERYLTPFIENRVAFIDDRAKVLGYALCGPMLVGFCQWLHKQIDQGDYNQVLFCSRDMELTKRLYLTLYPEDAERSHYFYVSQKSLSTPYWYAVDAGEDAEGAKQFENLRDYLSQLGCSGSIAIVDSGLTGRSLKMLSAITSDMLELHGLYLTTSKSFRKRIQDTKSCGYLSALKADTRQYVCSGFRESLISAFHGRVEGYEKADDGTVIPAFGEPRSRTQAAVSVQDGIELFARDYVTSIYRDCEIPPKDMADCFSRLAFFPKRVDLDVIGDIPGGNSPNGKAFIERNSSYYLLHPRQFLTDLQHSGWKGGFFRHCLSVFANPICMLYLKLNCYIIDTFGEWNDKEDFLDTGRLCK